MLADAKLPVTFWAKAVNTACYVQNRVLVNKSHNKTLYELFNGRSPAIGFLKPFGCHVMILNNLDHLGKFEAKGDEAVVAGTNYTNFSGTKDAARQEVKKDVSSLRYIALTNWIHEVHLESSSSQPQETCNSDKPESSGNSNPTATSTNPLADQLETLTVETPIPTVSSPVPTACLNDSPEPSKESNGVEADVSNMETTITASPTPALKIHKDHPKKPKKISDTLQDPRWVEAMQVELLQFKIQNVWTLVDCPKGPLGFQDLEFPVRVYKVEKAMYGLHQAPRAWYGTLSKYLLTNGFQRGTIDQTLFIKRQKGNFILVQVYVDDIIFGSSNP
nr:retrotransposon protein, putative, unclassified [Tanacetum cinerariifolium]